MQHWYLLEQVEQSITGMDKDHLVRARLLLQSDLWSTNSYLDDRKMMAHRQVSELEAERDRIERAMVRIEKRIEALV
ncbi:MAG: hypothetical protein HF981_00510 [Desulfobacteraceae bacterium]|nr:hypothetical protein [Desulfobacteraceae bacterium]MBC2748850.1 hypothetical protein [Desulfobacteraceae bacterium]